MHAVTSMASMTPKTMTYYICSINKCQQLTVQIGQEVFRHSVYNFASIQCCNGFEINQPGCDQSVLLQFSFKRFSQHHGI